ncbi:dephospho-CoA kinase, partial [uncultured Lutibacter sp.]|uniref:dephospho-CoA kinase n=1 Tax=uncultured Lutibacter sp. TaxID=437739 RepID=UPI0026137667
MIVIGLTGGIGSGKSTVLKMFQEFGAATYIADIEAKKLMNTNKELVLQVK